MADAGVNDHMVVSPDDHRAYIVITAIVGLVWSILVLCIRVFIRTRLSGPFGSDDAAASLATLVAVCQTSTVLYAVREGVGVRFNESYYDSVDAGLKAYYASSIMYIMALCPAKASMSLLISRVSRQAADKHLLATRIVTAIILVWGLSSVFIVAFQCGRSRPWDFTMVGHCPALFPRWLAIETVSLVIELLISGLAISLVLGLDMALQTKLIVIFAFSAQLLVAVPVAYRLVLLRDATAGTGTATTTTTTTTINHNHHPGRAVMFTLANTTIVTQVVMHFSVIAATFPCFRQFLQAFNNDFGATTKMGSADGTGRSGDRSQGDRSNGSYSMSVLPSRADPGGSSSIPATRLRDPESDTEVDEAVLAPLMASGEGLATPADDGRSLQSVGSERFMIPQKQERL
ncbi:MFS transporter [Cordyceps javanica]|uniref:MFS transporter n=1 Tax=Cordyceps javanica TaxID=43265 RepID=A0A545VWS8_9HYPO|nr:MFS transporter [Cordyceps javanica]TQW06169.1 MFS transporter [Cordyceps javanica]